MLYLGELLLKINCCQIGFALPKFYHEVLDLHADTGERGVGRTWSRKLN